MNGKGSKPRPYSIPKAEYDRRWAVIFGKKKIIHAKRITKTIKSD